jgi:hypothetical protein
MKALTSRARYGARRSPDASWLPAGQSIATADLLPDRTLSKRRVDASPAIRWRTALAQPAPFRKARIERLRLKRTASGPLPLIVTFRPLPKVSKPTQTVSSGKRSATFSGHSTSTALSSMAEANPISSISLCDSSR